MRTTLTIDDDVLAAAKELAAAQTALAELKTRHVEVTG